MLSVRSRNGAPSCSVASSSPTTIRCRRSVSCLLLALGFFPALQAPAQDQASDANRHIISGHVVNAVTQEPIGRALVVSNDNRFATLTDSDGRFEFAVPSESTPKPGAGTAFTVISGAAQLTGASLGIFLSARKPGFLDVPYQQQWAQASPDHEVTIPLIPEAIVKGRVALSSGDPALGIEVQIFSRQVQDGMAHWVPATSVRTNSAGEFRFADLRPGDYKLFTRELLDNDPVSTPPGGPLYGYPPIYYPGVIDFAAGSAIHLSAGQIFQADLSPVRQPYYQVTIPVANADSNNGLNVTVSLHGHAGPGYSLGYNSEKNAIQGLLPRGVYLVHAASFGPNPASGAVNIVVAGAPVEGPTLALTRNGSLTLNVTEEFTSTVADTHATWSDGKRTFALRGPRLYLQASLEPADDFSPMNGGSLRPPQGPDDDSLVIENLAPGRYWLRLHANRGYVASATMAGIDLLHHPFVFVPGSTAPIEITMRDDSAEIEGAVIAAATASPYPVAQSAASANGPTAYVYCIPLADGSGEFQQLWVSADGSFHSQIMSPGTYRVLAFKTQHPDLPYRDAEAMGAYDTKGQVVTLSPGQKQNLQLQLISSE